MREEMYYKCVVCWVGLEVDVQWLCVVRCEDLSERGWVFTEGNLI